MATEVTGDPGLNFSAHSFAAKAAPMAANNRRSGFSREEFQVTSSTGSRFALDMAGLSDLKQRAAQQSPGAAGEVAEQFEAMFLQIMLQSMRDTIPESGLLGSPQSRFYEELMDQQWSRELAGKGLGLADQLTAQLSSYVEESR